MTTINTRIHYRFERLEHTFCSSPAVQEYRVIYSVVTQYAGQMRVRATLVDGGLFEIFEHLTKDPDDRILVDKYRYHWQGAAGNLVRRWDTAAHHAHLPHAPHHVHLPDGHVEGVARPPDLAAVRAQIEAQLAES